MNVTDGPVDGVGTSGTRAEAIWTSANARNVCPCASVPLNVYWVALRGVTARQPDPRTTPTSGTMVACSTRSMLQQSCTAPPGETTCGCALNATRPAGARAATSSKVRCSELAVLPELLTASTRHVMRAGQPKVRLADTRYAYLDINGDLVEEWTQNERWEE